MPDERHLQRHWHVAHARVEHNAVRASAKAAVQLHLTFLERASAKVPTEQARRVHRNGHILEAVAAVATARTNIAAAAAIAAAAIAAAAIAAAASVAIASSTAVATSTAAAISPTAAAAASIATATAATTAAAAAAAAAFLVFGAAAFSSPLVARSRLSSVLKRRRRQEWRPYQRRWQR
eukprot:656859-Pleurochrysis_carterae.AAC.1